MSMLSSVRSLCLRQSATTQLLASTRRAMVSSTPKLPSSATKTPIQQWGWNYLVRQKALQRPISPHLSIYKPLLTWMLSGAHRILGCVVAVGGAVVVITLIVAPFDFTDFIATVKSWNIPRPIIGAFKFIVAFPIVFHSINGIRFLGFDMAKGVSDIKAIYRSGWLILGLSIILSAYIAWFMPTTLPVGEKVQQRK